MICNLVESTEVVKIKETLKSECGPGEHLGALPRINLTKKINRGCIPAFFVLETVFLRKIELTAQ